MIAGKRFSLVFILAACWVPTAFGDPSIDGLSRSRWAERLPGGPMKVVFLAPYGAQQDSFELMQRFDIDGTVVMMAAYDTQGYLNGLRNVGHYWPELWPMAEDAHAALGELVAAGDGDWHDVPSGQKDGQPSRVTSSPKLVPAAVRESFRAAGPERILSDESETTLSGSDHSEVASC